MLGTFTASTTPDAGQAQAVIDDAVAVLIADMGQLPAIEEVRVAARNAVEWRAAADIEISYPNRDADVRVYDQLNARAADAYATLRRVLAEAGAGLVDVAPDWSFPPAPSWGDTSPGSGTDMIGGGWWS
jgi:hypothetical protein